MSGTCQSCRRTFDTERDRLVAHDYATIPPTPCSGSGKASVEHREKLKAKRTAERWKEVEAVRAAAAVTLDAVLVGRDDMQKQLVPLLKMALVEYRLRFPLARVQEIWKNIDRAHAAGHRSGRVDVYCTFCAELLAQDWKRGWDVMGSVDAFKLVDSHCVPCALQHLAGMRQPEVMRARKLPPEALA